MPLIIFKLFQNERKTDSKVLYEITLIEFSNLY